MSFTRNIRPQLSFKDVYFITFFFCHRWFLFRLPEGQEGDYFERFIFTIGFLFTSFRDFSVM